MSATRSNARSMAAVIAVAAGLSFAWASTGFAQDRRKPVRTRAAQPAEPPKPAEPQGARKPANEGKAPSVQVDESGRKKVYRIKTEFVIEGRIQKPNAFYVLQRANINYEWVELKHEFVPRILQTVREKPF